MRALVRVRAGGRAGERRLNTRRLMARIPPNDPCTTLAPHQFYTMRPKHIPINPRAIVPTSDSPASNRLPNGAVYDPRCLTPPALSSLCGASKHIGVYVRDRTTCASVRLCVKFALAGLSGSQSGWGNRGGAVPCVVVEDRGSEWGCEDPKAPQRISNP